MSRSWRLRVVAAIVAMLCWTVVAAPADAADGFVPTWLSAAGEECQTSTVVHSFFRQPGTTCARDLTSGYRGYGYMSGGCDTPYAEPDVDPDHRMMCVWRATRSGYQWDGRAWRESQVGGGTFVYVAPFRSGWVFVYDWNEAGVVGGGWSHWFVVQSTWVSAVRFTPS